jgi:hypothetical protein
MTKIVKLSYFFKSKIALFFFVGLPGRRPKLQAKPSSLKRKHTALQNMEFVFLWFILPSWSQIQPTKFNADPSGSTTLDVTYGIYVTEGCESYKLNREYPSIVMAATFSNTTKEKIN